MLISIITCSSEVPYCISLAIGEKERVGIYKDDRVEVVQLVLVAIDNKIQIEQQEHSYNTE
jgi:hypothetical protein